MCRARNWHAGAVHAASIDGPDRPRPAMAERDRPDTDETRDKFMRKFVPGTVPASVRYRTQYAAVCIPPACWFARMFPLSALLVSCSGSPRAA
jgi:hypothetical protein